MKKLIMLAMFIGMSALLTTEKSYAYNACGSVVYGKIVAVGTAFCGLSSCQTYQLNIDQGSSNICNVNVPILGSVGLLTYAMDQGKTVTVATYPVSTWSTSCSTSCAYAHVSVGK